jgi:hypothetical protein
LRERSARFAVDETPRATLLSTMNPPTPPKPKQPLRLPHAIDPEDAR